MICVLNELSCVIVIQVIVELGIVIVLSCVGSCDTKVVSCASAVAPSNTIPFAPIFIPDVDVFMKQKSTH